MPKCEECGSKVVEEKGYQVCSRCGLALQRILEGSEKSIKTTSKRHRRIPKGKKTIIGITEIDTQALEFMKEVFVLLEIPIKIQEQTRSCYYKCARNYPDLITDHVLLTAVCLINTIGESNLTINDVIEVYRLFGRILLEEDIRELMEKIDERSNILDKSEYELLEKKVSEYIDKKDVLSIDELVTGENEDFQYQEKRYMDIIVEALAEINTEQSVEALVRYFEKGCINSSEIINHLAEMNTNYVVKSLIEMVSDGFDEDVDLLVPLFRTQSPDFLLDIIKHESDYHEHWIPFILKEFISNKDLTILEPVLYSILEGYDIYFISSIKEALDELEENEWFKNELNQAIQSFQKVSSDIRYDFVPLFRELLPDFNQHISDSVDELIVSIKPIMKTRFRTILNIEPVEERNDIPLEELQKVQKLIKKDAMSQEIKKQIVSSFDLMTKPRYKPTLFLTKKGYELYHELNQHTYFYMTKKPDFRKHYAELLLEHRTKGTTDTRDLRKKLYSFYLQKKPNISIFGEIIFFLLQIQLTIETLKGIIDET